MRKQPLLGCRVTCLYLHAHAAPPSKHARRSMSGFVRVVKRRPNFYRCGVRRRAAASKAVSRCHTPRASRPEADLSLPLRKAGVHHLGARAPPGRLYFESMEASLPRGRQTVKVGGEPRIRRRGGLLDRRCRKRHLYLRTGFQCEVLKCCGYGLQQRP